MKKIWIVGMVLMLILVACAPAEKAPAEEAVDEAPEVEETPAEKPVEEKVEKPEPVEEPETGRTEPDRPLPSERHEDDEEADVVVEEPEELSPRLKDLLKRSEGKVKSYQFLYGGPETGNLFLDTYFVKEDMLKIRTYDEDYYVREGYYDNIYAHLGIACCEENSRCQSHNVDNTQQAFEVDVDTMKIATLPHEWIKKVRANAEYVGPQTFDERSVTFIKYTDEDGSEVHMLIDDTYGLVHRVIVISPEGTETKYQFNDMLFNHLRDNDFSPPCD